MKLCSACGREFSKESFSKNQWKLKQYQRRCKECVDANREVQLDAPKVSLTSLPPSVCDEGASCWICLEEGPDETGQPLKRDCSCRGSAGYAHVSCIVKYAEQKIPANAELGIHSDSNDFTDFTTPWRVCPNCHQDYQNDLALNTATEFVSYVEKNHPQNQIMLIAALGIKRIQTPRPECKLKIAHVIISLVERSEKHWFGGVKLPFSVITSAATAYRFAGSSSLSQGSGVSETSLKYLGRSREIFESIGFTTFVADIDKTIAWANFDVDGEERMTTEHQVQISRDLYELFSKGSGEESNMSIAYGIEHAIDLDAVSRRLEAERLISKLVEISRRVNGKNHPLTKKAASALQHCK